MELKFEFELRPIQEARLALNEIQEGLMQNTPETDYQNVLQLGVDALRIKLKTRTISIMSVEDMLLGIQRDYLSEMRGFINHLLYSNLNENPREKLTEIFIATAIDPEDYQVGIAGGIVEVDKVIGIEYLTQEEYRRKGVAKALHEHTLNELKKRGVKRIETGEDLDEETILFLNNMSYSKGKNGFYLDI